MYNNLIFLFFFLVSCQPSDRISFIHDIRTCNDSNLTVSFNLTDADCSHYGYHIVVIHNVSQTEKPSKQLPIPYQYNGTNICHFFLTLDDAVTADEFHDSRLQIRIYNNSSPLLCSNYFHILVDEGKLNLPPSLPPSLPPLLSPSLSSSLSPFLPPSLPPSLLSPSWLPTSPTTVLPLLVLTTYCSHRSPRPHYCIAYYKLHWSVYWLVSSIFSSWLSYSSLHIKLQ